MEAITIRPAATPDLHSIQNLSHELFISDFEHDSHLNMHWSYQEDGENYLREKIENHEKNICLVAESNGILVGYIAGSIPDDNPFRPIKKTQLDNIFVQENYRQQGIGTKLVSQFVDWSRQKGATHIQVVAYAGNMQATEFYEHVGFKPFTTTFEAEIV